MVRRLGFVQVDSISAVERAQHHILFSRNPLFVPEDLKSTLEERRSLFEHWTHDAAILPVSVYPYWKHCFARQKKYEIHPGYKRYFAPVTRKAQTDVIRRIESEGPLKPRDFRSEKIDWGIKGIPTPSLAKITLEYLWRVGKLAVSRRDKREKISGSGPNFILLAIFSDLTDSRDCPHHSVIPYKTKELPERFPRC